MGTRRRMLKGREFYEEVGGSDVLSTKGVATTSFVYRDIDDVPSVLDDQSPNQIEDQSVVLFLRVPTSQTATESTKLPPHTYALNEGPLWPGRSNFAFIFDRSSLDGFCWGVSDAILPATMVIIEYVRRHGKMALLASFLLWATPSVR